MNGHIHVTEAGAMPQAARERLRPGCADRVAGCRMVVASFAP